VAATASAERPDDDVTFVEACGTQELVVMVGVQGCGKSTWVRENMSGTHAVVSKDHWPNARHKEARQTRVVAEHLAAGRSVVVDNTNPGLEERAPLLALARAAGVRIRAVWIDLPFRECLRRNLAREGRAQVPVQGLLRVRKRLVPPTLEEGFDQVDVVRD
jgi:predicted kinase